MTGPAYQHNEYGPNFTTSSPRIRVTRMSVTFVQITRVGCGHSRRLIADYRK